MRGERIEAILAEVRGPHVLNLGCVGHVLPVTEDERQRWLHLRLVRQFPGAQVLGLDIDQKNIDKMRANGMNAELGDAQRLTYDSQFDTIVLGELIEHLENPGACLEGCRRALKRGGRIVISTPNIFCTMQTLMYLKNFDHAFNPEHVVWFCPQTLRALVERCGLLLESFHFVDDLAPNVVSDVPYRLFSYAWLGVRWALPHRYRNTMVAVCVAQERQTKPVLTSHKGIASSAFEARWEVHPVHHIQAKAD